MSVMSVSTVTRRPCQLRDFVPWRFLDAGRNTAWHPGVQKPAQEPTMISRDGLAARSGASSANDHASLLPSGREPVR